MGKKSAKQRMKEQRHKVLSNKSSKYHVGRSLKKANDTNVEFRSTKIVLPVQLRNANENEVTKRCLSLSDLLLRLQHYNINNRAAALRGLTELIEKNNQVLSGSLHNVLDKCCFLLSDSESTIRTCAIGVLKQIFMLIAEENMSGHFSMMIAHLRGALTHVREDVRIDSVSMVELLVSHYPSLTLGKSAVLLQTLASSLLRQEPGITTAPSSDSLLHKRTIRRFVAGKIMPLLNLAKDGVVKGNLSESDATPVMDFSSSEGVHFIPLRCYSGRKLRIDELHIVCGTSTQPERAIETDTFLSSTNLINAIRAIIVDWMK